MTIVTNKNGKITSMNGKPIGHKIQPSPLMMNQPSSSLQQTNWVEHTKSFAKQNNMSFGESLSNVDNRCQYYDTMIDRNKYNRGPNLLQPDHPAMHPFIPNLSPQDKKIKDEIYVQTKRSMCGKTPTFKNK
jgi:hypothetical protein